MYTVIMTWANICNVLPEKVRRQRMFILYKRAWGRSYIYLQRSLGWVGLRYISLHGVGVCYRYVKKSNYKFDFVIWQTFWPMISIAGYLCVCETDKVWRWTINLCVAVVRVWVGVCVCEGWGLMPYACILVGVRASGTYHFEVGGLWQLPTISYGEPLRQYSHAMPILDEWKSEMKLNTAVL